MSTNSSIFIHSWWRSSSTYVWLKLRQEVSLQCFYEPLHEGIAGLNVNAILSGPEVSLGRMLRHPAAEKHNFFEYLEPVRSGTLRYTPDLAYERYILRRGQVDPGLFTYIDGLISVAAGNSRRAVLCFCRSQMRSAWMKENFAGTHIAQIRNPFDQWVSFQVNPYFIARMMGLALSLRKLHPGAFTHIEDFERQARELSNRAGHPRNYSGPKPMSKRDVFRIYMIIWIASATQSISNSDFVLDVDLLSNDRDYQKLSTHKFLSLGCKIDFSDCLAPQAESSGIGSPEIKEAVDDAIRAIKYNAKSLAIFDAEAISKFLPALGRASREIVSLAAQRA
jgi:hypothetical protein